MAEQLTREMIADKAIIHPELPATLEHALPDRSFELPTALYPGTVALFMGFIAVTAYGFAHREPGIPTAIFVLFVVAAFGVPAMWTRLVPDTGTKPLSWANFRRDGVHTLTGHNTASQAVIQVIMLPALVFCWGVVTVAIAAVVS